MEGKLPEGGAENPTLCARKFSFKNYFIRYKSNGISSRAAWISLPYVSVVLCVIMKKRRCDYEIPYA